MSSPHCSSPCTPRTAPLKTPLSSSWSLQLVLLQNQTSEDYREWFGLLKGLLVLPCPPSKNCIHPEWGKGLKKSLWIPHIPSHLLFELLPSCWRYRAPNTRTARHKNSLFSQAIYLMNSKMFSHCAIKVCAITLYLFITIHPSTSLQLFFLFYSYSILSIAHLYIQFIYFFVVYLYLYMCILFTSYFYYLCVVVVSVYWKLVTLKQIPPNNVTITIKLLLRKNSNFEI